MLHISKLVSGLMLVELVISLLIRQLLIENKLAKFLVMILILRSPSCDTSKMLLPRLLVSKHFVPANV